MSSVPQFENNILKIIFHIYSGGYCEGGGCGVNKFCDCSDGTSNVWVLGVVVVKIKYLVVVVW